LSRDIITDQNGNINYDLFDRLKSDGTSCIHVSTDLTDDERLEVYNRMGPGIVMVPDGSFMTGNYTDLHQLTGYVDLYLSYNEAWMYDGEGPDVERRKASVPYDTTGLWDAQGPVLRDDQIDFIVEDLHEKGYDAPPLLVNVRNYNQQEEVANIALENENIVGVLIEMETWANRIGMAGFDRLINNTFDAGKIVVLQLTPTPEMDYRVNMVQYLNELKNVLSPERYNSDDLYIVVCNYGITEALENDQQWKTPWFGPGNSIEETVKALMRRKVLG
jgi:hypothetical protein